MYVLVALMLSLAIIYFIVASFGENLEQGGQQAKAAAPQENIEGIHQHEAAENNHNVISGATQIISNNRSTSTAAAVQGNKTAAEINRGNNLTDVQQQKEATEKSSIGHKESSPMTGELGNESAKRSIELPLFLISGVAYVSVGIWIIVDKKRNRVPYMASMAGSLLLIGLYVISHTVGLPIIGLERAGLLDLLVAALQGGIVLASGYILLSSSKAVARTQLT